MNDTSGQIEIDSLLKETIDTLIADKSQLQNMGSKAANYVKENAGATNATLSILQEKRLLTN